MRCDCGNKPCDEEALYCHHCGKPIEEREEEEVWDRTIEEIPCIQIEAEDWLQRKDIKEWAENEDLAMWKHAGDIFTVFDHGEGPDCPGTDGKMPWWLWNTIKRIVTEKNVAYCVVRLMNVTPSNKTKESRESLQTLVDIILNDLGDENECQTDWKKGTFGDLLKNIVAQAEVVKKNFLR